MGGGGMGHKHTIAPNQKSEGAHAPAWHSPPPPHPPLPTPVLTIVNIGIRPTRWIQILYTTGVGSGGGGGAMGACAPPHFFDWGGQWYVCAPPLLTPHFYFPLELYVYITLTNNNLAFFIYQLIILWTITIKWHRWLLVNNHISNYNSFILVLYRRYINHVSVCPPTFWHLATPLYTIL